MQRNRDALFQCFQGCAKEHVKAKIHEIVRFRSYTRGKGTQYVNCAFLHRLRNFYISHRCTRCRLAPVSIVIFVVKLIISSNIAIYKLYLK